MEIAGREVESGKAVLSAMANLFGLVDSEFSRGGNCCEAPIFRTDRLRTCP